MLTRLYGEGLDLGSSDGEVVHLAQSYAGHLNTRADGLPREVDPAPYPAESLLFHGGDKLIIAQNHGRNITVLCVHPYYNHKVFYAAG